MIPGISPFCRAPARLIWNIYPLFEAHAICPRSFLWSLLLLFTFQNRQTLAWLCQNFTMCSAATLTNILTLFLSSQVTLTEPMSDRSCRTFINMYSVQLEDWIHWIIATLRLKIPTMPTHYRLLANRTMPPFSSHRNINKVCLLPSLMSPLLPLCFPTSFKKSLIIPVPKNNKPSCLNDYVPVALTSIVMEVFERLVKNYIRSSIPDYLDPLQFAYRPKRSIEDAISHVLYSSLTHVNSNNGNYVRLLFIDYNSAFNTVVPIKLAFKLTDFGLNSSLCD